MTVDIEDFVEGCEVYCLNKSAWLVDWARAIATHCNGDTYAMNDLSAIYQPTHEEFLMFLEDENWQKEINSRRQ